MVDIQIIHLRHFNTELERKVLAPLRAEDAGDKQALAAMIDFGNAFMERERANIAYQGAVIWFDVHMGEPAHIGMTWAYNDVAPIDPRFGTDSFRRMWSEVMSPSHEVLSLEQAQQEFSAYCLNHITRK